MSPDISERSFEEAIACALLQYGPDACGGDAAGIREPSPPYGESPPGGYRRRRPEDYDRALGLLPRDVVDFVLATQPKEWKKLEQHHGAACSMCCARGSRTRAASSGWRTSGPRAGSTRRRGGCTRRTSSPSCARSATARRTSRASTWCSS